MDKMAIKDWKKIEKDRWRNKGEGFILSISFLPGYAFAPDEYAVVLSQRTREMIFTKEHFPNSRGHFRTKAEAKKYLYKLKKDDKLLKSLMNYYN